MAEYIYDTHPFGEFSYDRDKFYDNDIFGTTFLELIKPNDKIIDVGCGEGYVLNYLAKKKIKKKNMLGADLSDSALKYVKNKGFNVKKQDNTNMTLKSNSYNIVISNGVIHHTNNYVKSFKELVRILKKDGYVYLTVYNKIHPYYILYKITRPVRYLYWSVNKKFVLTFIFPFFRWFYFTPVFIILSRKIIDKRTSLTLFYDSILTPIAEFRTKKYIENLIKKNKCKIVVCKIERSWQMITAVFTKV